MNKTIDIPDWDTYYMGEAFWIASRSPDPRTKHGSIIVKNHKPISQGYNGYPKDCNDAKMPNEPPQKYKVILHSEVNAILFANESLEGATIYVTGMPCSQCLCKIIQKGITRIVYGPQNSFMLDESEKKVIEILLQEHPELEVVEYINPDITYWCKQYLKKIKTLFEKT